MAIFTLLPKRLRLPRPAEHTTTHGQATSNPGAHLDKDLSASINPVSPLCTESEAKPGNLAEHPLPQLASLVWWTVVGW